MENRKDILNNIKGPMLAMSQLNDIANMGLFIFEWEMKEKVCEI